MEEMKNIDWKKVGKWALIGGGVIGTLAAIVGAGLAIVQDRTPEELSQESTGEGEQGV